MKDDIPLIYWRFRSACTVLHCLVMAAAAIGLLTWALTDNHAATTFESAINGSFDREDRASSDIPSPEPVSEPLGS